MNDDITITCGYLNGMTDDQRKLIDALEGAIKSIYPEACHVRTYGRGVEIHTIDSPGAKMTYSVDCGD